MITAKQAKETSRIKRLIILEEELGDTLNQLKDLITTEVNKGSAGMKLKSIDYPDLTFLQ